MTYDQRFETLNDNQRTAVTTIDGPLMVVAGPGTGKTELLGMRVANILRITDALPENILCLTFTEAGSIAMQKRLREIIGRDSSKVSIFTFHAFGTEIMGRYREYFYNGASFKPADDLRRHEILTSILDTLKYDDPLKSRMNGEYTSIRDIIKAISDLKRAGLTDSEFKLLLDVLQGTVDVANPILKDVFASRISTSTVVSLNDALAKIKTFQEDAPISGMAAFHDVLTRSIEHALLEASNHPKTTPPVTEWKKQWMTADVDKSQVLKAYKNLPKLRSLAHVYGKYLEIMQKSELLDYDDMIMQVVHAIEVNPDLKADLQEKYQYIMVDEFQDTNLAQMRIIHNLTDSEVNDGNPNLMVVGDDDQAIYGFQGAEVGNILSFREMYPASKLITLTENYRSVQDVLDGAREVIIQGEDRLERHYKELNKQLTSRSKQARETLEIVGFETTHNERDWVAKSVRKLIDDGAQPGEIAIIGRKHNDLVSLLSYLSKQEVPISYDKRDNILEDEVIVQLELLARVVNFLAIGEFDEANSLMPELLAHPAWGISPETIWEVSLASYRNTSLWLETMSSRPDTSAFHKWIITTASQALFLPLERIVDILIGNTTLFEDYTSPLKAYFFKNPDQTENIAAYTSHLENLSTLRRLLREHTSDESSARISDLLDFIDENRSTDTKITSYRHIGNDEASVQLMSAHGSKGLEFNHVFILNATDQMWGEKASGKSSVIGFPENMRLAQSSGSYDERLRLFYVAMTRARVGLHISFASENDSAKEVLMAAFLLGNPVKLHEITDDSATAHEEAAVHNWYAPIINIPKVTMQDYLKPVLDTYKLSATHVNSFIDVTRGGPEHFLLNSLLKFPSAPNVNSTFGTILHSVLQRVHDHLRATSKLLPEEDILNSFETSLNKLPLTDDERKNLTERGCDALRAFMRAKGESFNKDQQAEVNFINQGVVIGDASLTGKLDVVEFDKAAKTVIVTDYKSGKTLETWDKGDKYDKIKAHKYRQQLMFYKLLIENSREWSDYTMANGVLQFIEPTKAGEIIDLQLSDIDSEELERFKQLVQAVWKHVHALKFPDTSSYSQDIKGVLAFEDDLLTGKYL